MNEIIKFAKFLIALFVVIFIGILAIKLLIGAAIVLSVIFFITLKLFLGLLVIAAIGTFLIYLI